MLGHPVKATILKPPFLSSSTEACGMCSEPQQQTHTAAHHMEILHIARSVDSMPCVHVRWSTLRLGTFSSLSATARPPSAPNPLPAHITHCCSSSASSSTAGQSNQNRSRYDRVTQMLFTLETNRRIWIQSSHGKSQNKSCSLYSVSLALAACPSILFAFNRE